MGTGLKMVLAAVAIAGAVAGGMAYAQAQARDPAYQAARSQGQIGEKPDGYLGFVTPPSPAIKALVDDLNIKRKAAYTREAAASGATVADFAFTSGCRLIANTAGGEKYQTPDGSWQTRGSGPPARDSRCP